ncbi:hypothetical protein DWB77_07322 [Streptomyces hundungensis]|uniref:Uncharacterized protein n=1 Tax=Streptomyces hundungensis TaxID=1077946 RepID=A0A387HMG2_9ACTN|nr:hypothetical protein DWB77_07322 [Streptomyces hundungensis]
MVSSSTATGLDLPEPQETDLDGEEAHHLLVTAHADICRPLDHGLFIP